MHEYSVTKSLVDLCNQEAQRNEIKNVHKVYVTIGKFTGFSPDAVRFYFDYLRPGTRCAQAELVFKEVPIIINCNKCNHNSPLAEPVMICPQCGDIDITLISGREFYVESIEGE